MIPKRRVTVIPSQARNIQRTVAQPINPDLHAVEIETKTKSSPNPAWIEAEVDRLSIEFSDQAEDTSGADVRVEQSETNSENEFEVAGAHGSDSQVSTGDPTQYKEDSDFRLDFELEEVPVTLPLLLRKPGASATEAIALEQSKAPDLGNNQTSMSWDENSIIPGFQHLGSPDEIVAKLDKVGYQCYHYLAVQLSLLFNSPSAKIRALLLEGPSGCGKSFMAKCLAKIAGAELMCLSCYKGMPTQNLIESPSTLAMVNTMAGKGGDASPEALMNLGILSRAYLKSQTQPVILLIDELDKPDGAIDTFFLGPIQDARIWLESRAPIDANIDNILMIFTKNWNRTLDEALLRRVHPIRMNYLDSTLEKKILSPHCHPQLVANLVTIADRMRNSGGSYAFERPPAPEELLTAGHYVTKLLEWNMSDFGFVGRNIWAILAKSEHDRAVLEHMMRYHPDFMDPLVPDAKNASLETIQARLGRIVLEKIINDPDAERREKAWKDEQYQ